MTRLFSVISALILIVLSTGINTEKIETKKADICIYGGTSAGVMAAYSASKRGMTVILVEPSRHLGGLSSGGLGATDIGKEESVVGLARDYYLRLGKKYGLNDVAWHFEPHKAEDVFNEYIAETNTEVLFDYSVSDVAVRNTKIQTITLTDHENGKPKLKIRAKMFIDASYEGDLMAFSGVSYTIGRESNEQYGETYNGVQISKDNQIPDGIDPYIEKGEPESGLLWGINPEPIAFEGSGDHKIQAYGYRICLTTNSENSIPIYQPENYDSSHYEILRRIIQHRDSIDWVQRIWQLYLRIIEMPNGKTDINNKGGFSLSMAGVNWEYPESDYFTRKSIAKKIADYNKGIIYFLATDAGIPQFIKDQMNQYGYPKDEFIDNGHFPHQLYIRESRRMLGALIMTEHHCMARDAVDDGIALGSYNMDSHNCDRHVVNGMVKNEGDVQVRVPGPYPISYRSILPKEDECSNLLVPVCLSASHIAYGSIRMEPVFMMLGEVAGNAASYSLKNKTNLDSVPAGLIKAGIPFEN